MVRVRCCVSQIFGGIFRCYAVVFSLFVGVLETEWGFIIKFCKVRFLPPISRFGMLLIANWLLCRFRIDGVVKLVPNLVAIRLVMECYVIYNIIQFKQMGGTY